MFRGNVLWVPITKNWIRANHGSVLFREANSIENRSRITEESPKHK